MQFHAISTAIGEDDVQAPSGTNGYEANVQPEDDYGHSSPQPVKVKGFVGGVLPDKKSDHV